MFKKRSHSIGNTLFMTFVMCMAPALVVFFFLAKNEYSKAYKSVEMNAVSAVSSLIIIQERLTLSAKMILSTLASTDEFKYISKAKIENSFRNIIKSNPDYANMHLALPNGNVVASAKPIPEGGVNLADRKHVSEAIKNKGFAIGEYVISRLTFEPVLPFAHAVLNDSNDVVAVIIAVLRLSSFSKYYSKLSQVPGSSVIISDHAKRLLFKFPDDINPYKLGSVDEDLKRVVSGTVPFVRHRDDDQIERVYAAQALAIGRMEEPYLYIAVGVPFSVFIEKARTTVLSWALIASLVVISSLLLSFFMIKKRLATNIKVIINASNNVVKGDYSARTNIQSADGDLGVIGEAFDSMVEKIEDGMCRLMESEERFRVLVEQAPEAIVVTDMETNHVVLVNNNAEALFGCDKNELLSQGIYRFYAEIQPDGKHYLQSIEESRRRAMAGEAVEVERIIKNARNEVLQCEVRIVRFPSKTKNMIRSSWIDITQRKNTERALRESEDQFRLLIETLPIGMVLFEVREGLGLQFISANPAARQQLKMNGDESFTKNASHVFPSLSSLETSKVIKSIQQGAFSTHHAKLALEDGFFHGIYELYSFMPKPTQFAIIFIDVTEKQKMHDIMIQTEKIMSVGGLAAGMAHEINNPLSAILQSAQVLEKRLLSHTAQNETAASTAGCSMECILKYCETREISTMMQGIREAGGRAAKIVSGMLEFSRKVESNRAPTDLRILLDKSVELCSNDYDLKKKYDFRSIQVAREYQPDLPSVPCTATHIMQVFMNLLKNAAQAMSSNPGTQKPSICLRAYSTGEDAVVEIEDNGPGMEESVRKHIFEPFFTTKPQGEGTGLGLSVSYFLITEKHNGTIIVESLPGEGTKFTIKLPFKSE